MPLSPRLRWKLDRFRENLSGLFGGSKEQARPKLCPACGQLVGATQTRCHQCGTSLTFSLAALSRSLEGMIPTASPVTSVILGVNLLIYGVCLIATIQSGQGFSGGGSLGGIFNFGGISGHVLDRLGARDTIEVLDGEWWRLITAIFLHGSLMHILFNSYVLWDCGTQVEDVYGSARTLFLYMATGVLSFVWSSLWDIGIRVDSASVGASGAIMGLVGLMLAIASRRGGAYMRDIRAGLIRWIIIIFALGFIMGGIDNAAHFGGLVSGYALGRVFDDREPQAGPERKRAYLLGALGFVVAVGGFAAMILHYFTTSS